MNVKIRKIFNNGITDPKPVGGDYKFYTTAHKYQIVNSIKKQVLTPAKTSCSIVFNKIWRLLGETPPAAAAIILQIPKSWIAKVESNKLIPY